jgi:hypothetical protein
MSGDVIGKHPGLEMMLPEHFSSTQTWLGDCADNKAHIRCNKTISGRNLDARTAQLPTRCIEIYEPHQFHTQSNASVSLVSEYTPKIRLRETRKLRGPYLILSHRWRSDTMNCNTTVHNYQKRLLDIDFQSLTKTFQDAIRITCGLGVRHLWIDSVCIIQAGDGGLDFKRESVKMANYYQQSLLTIAGTYLPRGPTVTDVVLDGDVPRHNEAASSTSQRRSPGIIPPAEARELPHIIRLPYRNREGTMKGNFYLIHIRATSESHREHVQTSELFSRGWVFQEWLLSRRMIYYTPSGIVLECQEECRNTVGETCDNKWEGGSFQWSLEDKTSTKLLPGPVELTIPTWKHKPSFDNWYKIVSRYMEKGLTYPSDRLVALAGIASEFKEYMKIGVAEDPSHPCYISGLWKNDIRMGLLWAPWNESWASADQHQLVQATAHSVDRIKGMPSWSWASFPKHARWFSVIHGRPMLSWGCKIIAAGSMDDAPDLGQQPREVTYRTLDSKTRSYSSSRQSRYAHEETTDVVPMFSELNEAYTHLQIQGKIVPIRFRNIPYMSDGGHPFLIDQRTDRFGPRHCTRYVCLETSRDTTSGFASFDYQDYAHPDVDRQVFALHVSTEKLALFEGMSQGHWHPYQSELLALLISKAPGSLDELVLV